MKYRYIYLIVVLFFCSLTTVFGQITAQDSALSKALSRSVDTHQFMKPDRALLFIDMRKKFAESRQWRSVFIETCIKEAQIYSIKAEWTKSDQIVAEADKLMRVYRETLTETENKEFQVQLFCQRLLNASMTEDAPKLEHLFHQGAVLIEKNKPNQYDSVMISEVYRYQSIREGQRGNITEGLRRLDSYNRFLKTKEINIGQITDYTGYAKLRAELKQLSLAEVNFKKASSIAQQTKKDKDWQINYNNLLNAQVNYYIKIKKLSHADSCLRLLKSPKNAVNDLANKAEYVQTEGHFYKAKNELDKSIQAYTNALNLYIDESKKTTQLQTTNSKIAQSYLDIAIIRKKQKRFSDAMKAVNNGFTALDPTFHCDDYRDNPIMNKIASKMQLLKLLDCKTSVLLEWAEAQPLQQANYQTVAYRTAKNGIDLIDTIRKNFTNDYDRQYLLELMYPLYEKGISAAFQLYQRDSNSEYLTRAFDIFERSKAATLLQAIRTGQAEDEIETSDRYLLLDYRTQMSQLENSLHEALSKHRKDESDPAVSRLKRQLDSLKVRLDVLTKTFETKYPNYYRLKYSRPYAPLADVQKALPSDESTVLFEYFMGEKAIYIFAVSHGRVQLFRQPKAQDFEAQISHFLQLLRTPKAKSLGSDCAEYARVAHQFYELLWQGPLSIFPQKPRKMVVVADGLLCLLPFDGLLPSVPMSNLSYRTLPYLIHEHTLLYAYSANAYLEKRDANRSRPRSVFAGFAPIYPKGFPFAALPNSQTETKQLVALLGGNEFLGKDASEKQFKEHAANYRCLHLSMHSDMEEVNPMFTKLVFQPDSTSILDDNMLTPNEIYKLKLNADLVVLSACETGLGELFSGEGTMSFARAFQYAGVPNTVMSLWLADDEASKNVMIKFYKNLRNGQSKEDAMRNAKLEYLSRTKNEEEAFPFFWLTYNIIGNETDIDLSPPLSIWWLLGLPIAVCLLILGLRKWRNRGE
jgi:CHAT domain-containing protein